MKVAVAQLAAGPNRIRNIECTLAAMRSAAEQGAQLVVLPELCTSPYQLAEQPLDSWAEEIPGGECVNLWLREAENLKLCLVAGVLEQAEGSYYNTAVVLTPQGLLSRYRKAHLAGWERQRLLPGNDPFLSLIVEGVRVGVLICYDLRFMEVVRLLVLDGVQLLCAPNTWTDVGKPQPWDQYGLCGAVHMSLGYAHANRIFVLCANRVGLEGSVRYLGNSLIAAPSGKAVAGPAGIDETTILIAEIDPGEASDKHIGEDNDVLADRRLDLYNLEELSKSPRTITG